MHHISFCQGFNSFSARRRRTVSRDKSACSVSFTISPANKSNVQRARPAGGFEQAVRHQQRLFPAGQFARRPRTRLLSQCKLKVAFHEAALGAIHSGGANRHAGGNRFVAYARIGGQQDLRALDLARRVLAAAQQRGELVAFILA